MWLLSWDGYFFCYSVFVSYLCFLCCVYILSFIILIGLMCLGRPPPPPPPASPARNKQHPPSSPFCSFFFFFFFFHQFFYWVLAHALLSETVDFDLERTLLVAVLNAMVAVPLYHILDKLKVTD